MGSTGRLGPPNLPADLYFMAFRACAQEAIRRAESSSGLWLPALRGRAKLLEHGILLQMVRKILLVRGHFRTNQVMMNAGIPKLHHLAHGLVRGPALLGHSVGGHHHPGAVIAEAAVHKDLLVRIVPQKLEEPGKYFVLRKIALPRNRHILQSHAADLLAFAFALAAAGIHDNADAHPG